MADSKIKRAVRGDNGLVIPTDGYQPVYGTTRDDERLIHRDLEVRVASRYELTKALMRQLAEMAELAVVEVRGPGEPASIVRYTVETDTYEVCARAADGGWDQVVWQQGRSPASMDVVANMDSI